MSISFEAINSFKFIFEPNRDRVAAELIDGDAIIIHVVSGTYYNTQGIGGWVWERCAAGESAAKIATQASALYEVSKEQLETDLLAFFKTLKAEDLVEERPAERANEPDESTPDAKKPYVAPSLVIYRDLKDLLALDPPMPRMDLGAKYTV